MAMIEHIYDALLDDEALDALPGQLAAAVGARSSCIRIHQGEDLAYIGTSYFSAEMGHSYADEGFYEHDCWTNLIIERSLFDQAVDSDALLSREAFRDTTFHNDFFRRFGDDTGHSLEAVVRTSSGFVALGLNHALTAPAYADGVLEAFGDALPHLRRLADGRALITQADERAKDAETLLHAQATAILLVDRAGVIRFANAAAEGVLAAGDGLGSRCGALKAIGPEAARLELAIARAGAVRPLGDALTTSRPSGARPYRLLITPHRGRGARPGLVMVMIDDPTQRDVGLTERLQVLFGLSAAEADLATRLFFGESLTEASDGRGVLISTSRSQLNAILQKTGLHRQGELMAMIGHLPRPLV